MGVGLISNCLRAFFHFVQRARPAETSRLIFTNAASLIGTYGVTSIFGMAFWLVAARYYSKSTVGFTGGLIAAMALLGQLCTLGFGTMLIGELPRRRTPPRALITSAMMVSGAAGVVGGLLFALAAPEISSHYHRLVESFGVFMAFTGGVALTAASGVFDNATIGALRGGLQLWRNLIFTTAKLVVLLLLAVVVRFSGNSLLFSWVAGSALSLLFVFAVAHRRSTPVSYYRPRLSSLKGLWKEAVGHQAFNASFNVPVLVLPILVVGLVSAAANAPFYIALQIAGALYVVPSALAIVLFAIGTLEPAALAVRVRLTLQLSTVVVILGIVIVAAAGNSLLGVFGSSYREDGSLLLVLAIAAAPITIKTHFLTITRIERQVANRLPLVWAGACAEIGAGACGAALGGARGAAIGWLVALCAEAVAMLPIVWRTASGKKRFVNGARQSSLAVLPPSDSERYH